MTIDLSQLVLVGILTASLHWIIARAQISRPLWSRAPGVVGDLLACPACSGVWLGLFLGLLGARPVVSAVRGFDVGWCSVCGAWLTPVFQAVMLWGLERTKIKAD